MSHAPLPRAVGPYTVLRTTKLISSDAYLMMFATLKDQSGNWRSAAGLSSVDENGMVGALNNTYIHDVPFPGAITAGSGLTAVPSALSVQVMNGGALQTTTGIFAGAVSSANLDLSGRVGKKWTEVGSDVVSFMKPRLLSAGKLALRGVQADAYPLDMAAIADFKTVTNTGDGPFTWDDNISGAAAWNAHPAGWSPIVFVNQNKTTMNYLVTVEWRVRFDIGNPAVASHVDHGVSSDASWAATIKHMVDRGSGMMDIAEKAADMGADAAKFVAKFV